MADRPSPAPSGRTTSPAGWSPRSRPSASRPSTPTCRPARPAGPRLTACSASRRSPSPATGAGPVPPPTSASASWRRSGVSAEPDGRARVSFALVGVLALALAAIVATRPNPTPPLRGEAVAFAVRPAGVEASAVVAADGTGSLVELTATGLDPDTTYALWLTPPGGDYPERVAAGTFRPNERRRGRRAPPRRAAGRPDGPRLGHRPRRLRHPRHPTGLAPRRPLRALGRDALGDDPGDSAPRPCRPARRGRARRAAGGSP